MTRESEPERLLFSEVNRHYSSPLEQDRLSHGPGQLELARTQELLERYLPQPPAVVVDVGGGPGRYAFWLASLGYAVHLVDAMPLHIEQARATAAEPNAPTLMSIAVGDARELGFAEASVDAVLLLGPLYHLTARDDRLAALGESKRILKSGGVLLAACISRFASTLDGLARGFLDDPEFKAIVERDLEDGQHRNPTEHPAYFTTAYFHHPAGMGAEIEEAGLHHQATLAIEGAGWLLADFEESWRDPARRESLMSAIRRIEAEPSLMGVSAHILGVGRKSAG